jgi:thiosulfate/3-mercaptopyruvate sulfurtransferase
MELVDDVTHRYRPMEELRAAFADVAGRGERVITYCGGGIAASSDAFVLHLLGRDDVAVYDNSLSEWAADASLPMET